MLFDHDLCENNQSAQAAYAAKMHPRFSYGVGNGSGLKYDMLYSINLATSVVCVVPVIDRLLSELGHILFHSASGKSK